MKATYKLMIYSACPVDGLPDVYECEIESAQTIMVEKILEAAKELQEKKLTQEDATKFLHRKLAAAVKTTGTHSGVLMVVECK